MGIEREITTATPGLVEGEAERGSDDHGRKEQRKRDTPTALDMCFMSEILSRRRLSEVG